MRNKDGQTMTLLLQSTQREKKGQSNILYVAFYIKKKSKIDIHRYRTAEIIQDDLECKEARIVFRMKGNNIKHKPGFMGNNTELQK